MSERNLYGLMAAGGAPRKDEIYMAEIDRWFAMSLYCPQPGQFISIFDNITERKAAEASGARVKVVSRGGRVYLQRA